jgi:hypothetical protein
MGDHLRIKGINNLLTQREINMEMSLRKAQFTIEIFPGEIFEGFTDGEEWNG